MRAAFHTLGCKVNSYETQAITEQFKGLGFDVVDFSSLADVYVINTCSVTQIAAHKSRQMLHRARKMNPEALIVATGCYAQEDGEKLTRDSSVDMVIGNNHKSEIAGLVKEALDSRAAESIPVEVYPAISDLTHCRTFEDQHISTGENVRAYVKIQDGCDRFCSYCIIPYVRGRSRCRDEEEILSEVGTLAAAGYREVVLTGIDISMYPDIAGLIEKIDDIDGICRVRLGSAEQSMITEDFLKRVQKCSSFCPHFHLSLQSGCDEILHRMNRKYTTAEYASAVAMIRDAFAAPGITTDIIVGFPGESEEEFARTMEFARKIAFTQAHIFRFSSRKGTRAARMPEQISNRVKEQRSAQLISLTDEMQHSFESGLIGTEQPVLIEECVQTDDGRNVWIGHTPEYVRIAIPAAPASTGTDLTNMIISVTPQTFIKINGIRILAG